MRRVRAVKLQTGCSAAWLARLLGVQEVPGSNPGIPTNPFVSVAGDPTPSDSQTGGL